MNIINAQPQDSLIHYLINEIRIKYAPDKRTSLFNIEVKNNNGDILIRGEVDKPTLKNELEKILLNNNVKYLDEIKVLPDEKLKGKNFGIATVSVGNLRTNPNHSAEMASQVLLGTPVKVLKYEDGFYLVQTPDNYIAWIDDEGIEPMSKENFNTYLNSNKIIFTSEFGFAFQSIDANSAHVSDLVRGNILQLIGEEKDFFHVKFPDWRDGYIKKCDAIDFNVWLETREPSSKNILSEAFNMLGIPYLWGGTSYKGIDCSGFTKTVYFLNGILLSRDASQQVNLGIDVDIKSGFDNLQAGDLLFFGKKADENHKEKITHVGIYIGDLNYIHESGKVKVNSFDEKSPLFSRHRLNQFVRAKRIITSINQNGVELIMNNKFYRGEIE